MNFWGCAEVSFDQKYLYVGGCSTVYAKILMLKFDNTLEVVSHLELSMGEFRYISRLYRIPGSDVLIAGCS